MTLPSLAVSIALLEKYLFVKKLINRTKAKAMAAIPLSISAILFLPTDDVSTIKCSSVKSSNLLMVCAFFLGTAVRRRTHFPTPPLSQCVHSYNVLLGLSNAIVVMLFKDLVSIFQVLNTSL